MNDHKTCCFVAVPYGANEAEHNRWDGWVHEIIRPVVKKLDLEPFIAAAETKPNAITLEIREHLSHDALGIFDLGGLVATDLPNPNVMYELGIRHAFDLPVVILGWDASKLPFDVSEQRAITGERGFHTADWYRTQLLAFCQAALKGECFMPMKAVRVTRMLEIQAAHDPALKALTEEMKELKGAVRDALAVTARQTFETSVMRAMVSDVDLNFTRSSSRPLSSNRYGQLLSDYIETPLPLRQAARTEKKGE